MLDYDRKDKRGMTILEYAKKIKCDSDIISIIENAKSN